MGQAREVMDRVTEAVFAGDSEGLKAQYAPGAVAETPDEGTLRGPDAIATYLLDFTRAFPDARYEATSKHESGDTAIDEGHLVGTHTGPLAVPGGQAIEPTGRSVRLRSCDVATVEDGRVTSHRFYFDTMELMEQLGLVPQAETA